MVTPLVIPVQLVRHQVTPDTLIYDYRVLKSSLINDDVLWESRQTCYCKSYLWGSPLDWDFSSTGNVICFISQVT